MTPEEQHRFAALATQVALLHTALREAGAFVQDVAHVDPDIVRGAAVDMRRQIDAALAASEHDCAQLFTLARECADLAMQGRLDVPGTCQPLLALLDRLEGKGGVGRQLTPTDVAAVLVKTGELTRD